LLFKSFKKDWDYNIFLSAIMDIKKKGESK
jgi:hypothetical protein